MKCVNCSRELPEGSDFCPYCGSKQEEKIFCNKCGRELPPDSDYCQFCGNTIPKYDNNPLKDKEIRPQKDGVRSKKTLPIVIIILAVLLIVAIIVVIIISGKSNNTKESELVTEPPTETTAEIQSATTGTLSVEQLIASSHDESITGYKKEYLSYSNKNVHISGYVVDIVGNTITIAESMEWPYDTTTLDEYQRRMGYDQQSIQPADGDHTSFDDWYEEYTRGQQEFESIEKTPSLILTITNDSVKKPEIGSYVDVYFTAGRTASGNVFSIDVR